MSLAAPAVRLVVPVIANAPLSVIAPAAVTTRSPLIVDAPKPIAPMSLRVTLSALTIVTSPPKLFALSSVMSLAAPAVRLVVPVIANAPLSVIAPVAVTTRSPLMVDAPKPIAPVSLRVTLSALTIDTSPPKLFNWSSVMSLAAPAVRLVVPVIANAPLSVIAPAAVTTRSPLMVDAPKISAFASVIATAFAPVLVSDTAPPKSFAACVRVIAALPVVTLVVPPITSAPAV